MILSQFSVAIDVNEPGEIPTDLKELADNTNSSGSNASGDKNESNNPLTAFNFALMAFFVSMLGILTIWMETGKYKILLFIVVPLYVKRKKDKVLENFTRGEIYGFIHANPGTYFNHMKLSLDLANGTLAYHLSVLENDDKVYSRNDGRYRRFYPVRSKLPKVKDGGEMVHNFVQLNTTQDRIISVISDRPGLTQKDIAKLVGKSTQVVNYNIQNMSQLGLVKLKREGKSTKCYINKMHKIDKPLEVSWEE